jgi:dihydroorotate dehydrogenase (fumarate)
MPDLTTKYAGLTLKNPVIAASCGLTNSVENIRKLEKAGVAAVVLKSLFEEEILHQTNANIRDAWKNNLIYTAQSESLDYIDLHIRKERLDDYLQLVASAKNEVLIPVIASINCITPYEWTDFAEKIEDAGADALELNIALNPSDNTSSDFESLYQEIISEVRCKVSIPVTVKMSSSFTRLAQTIQTISGTGIAGLVLFNRFYSPDFNIENFSTISSSKFSYPGDFTTSLRWIALSSANAKCDLAASTGIHDGDSIVKLILAGARAVEVASVLYTKGFDHINTMLSSLEGWMQRKGFNYIDQFRGKMNAKTVKNPSVFERIQFMKYYSDIE